MVCSIDLMEEDMRESGSRGNNKEKELKFIQMEIRKLQCGKRGKSSALSSNEPQFTIFTKTLDFFNFFISLAYIPSFYFNFLNLIVI